MSRYQLQVIPRETIFWILLLAPVLVSVGLEAYWQYQFYSLNVHSSDIAMSDYTNEFWTGCAIWAALIYGYYRVVCFHPICDRDYLGWLRCTPFDGKQRLPLGPLHWVPSDLVFLAPFLLLAWYAGLVSPIHVVTIWTVAYYITAARVLRFCKYNSAAGSIALLSALPIALLQYPWGALVLAVAIYPIAQHFLQNSLRTIPYDMIDAPADANFLKRPLFEKILIADPAKGVKPAAPLFNGPAVEQVGYPLVILAPRAEWKNVRRSTAIWIAAITAAYTFAIARVVEMVAGVPFVLHAEARVAPVAVFNGLFLMLLALLWLSFLKGMFASPTSALGRLFMLRWIIPRHDVVFLGPILSVAISIVVTYVSLKLNPSLPIAWSLGLGAGVLVLFGVGPNIETWVLTGAHRLRRMSDTPYIKRI